ncbi:Predicted transcriptional regulator [Fructobacillus tropaeoli]|nr:Predicted transcriptional regulator [Fructobacillus tropaeoli]
MNRIKELRQQKKLSLAKLSDQLKKNYNLKISAPSLMRYENGTTEPKLATWQKLADFFDVPISYIQGTDSYSVREIEKLLENYKDDELGRDVKQKAFEKAYSDMPVIPDPTIPLLKKILNDTQNNSLTAQQKDLLDLFLSLLIAYDDQKEEWFTSFTENIFNFIAFKDFGFNSPHAKENLLHEYSKLIDKVIENKKNVNS